MPQKKQLVLFVSHNASRSGAPLLFLEIIKEFKKKSGIPFHIIVFEDGELVKEFAKLCPTYVWNIKNSKTSSILPAWCSGLFLRIKMIIRGTFILFSVRKSTLVFFNTISHGHLHKKLLFLKCRYIYYIHELEAAIHMMTNSENRRIIFKHTSLFLAVSNAVAYNLISTYAVDKSKVKVVATPFTRTVLDKEAYKDYIHSFKQQYNIQSGTVVIGVVASNEWRKGFSLFFPLIKLYFNLYPESNVFFVWKGFKDNNISSFFDLYEYKKFSLGNTLLLPHGIDSVQTIACMDIHLLLSREDPYPLVVLEAASLGVPTVCFVDAGGTPEFVEEDSGFCVPYGDLMQMAIRLHELAENKELRKTMGLKAQQKVKQRHAPQTTMPEFVKILEDNA